MASAVIGKSRGDEYYSANQGEHSENKGSLVSVANHVVLVWAKLVMEIYNLEDVILLSIWENKKRLLQNLVLILF